MSAIFENITSAIGFTPLVKLNRIANENATVLVKLEFYNPCHSVKDRIGRYMIDDAENKGLINEKTVLVEPTSGNTGIALAFVCASRGYKLILTMPESMSLERRKLLKIFGAQIILTPAKDGMTGALAKAQEIVSQNPDALMLQQFNNPANPRAHFETTAREIWVDSDGDVDIIVSGVGTGGTLSGCAKFLKAKKPEIKAIAVEPASSPVLSGGHANPHNIQGIGAGFIPENLDQELVDEIITVTDDDAIQTARDLAAKEGILSGISGGANVWAALEISKRAENKGKTIVTFVCDTGERYVSTELFEGL
jgi:cysteine synthase A